MEFTCKVIKGQGRGKKIGFPTFNLQIPQDLSLKRGIYASWVWLKDKKYPAALHYGPVPVFNNPKPSLEVFILNYPKPPGFKAKQPRGLKIKPVSYLRSIKNFSSIFSLKAQIRKDVEKVKNLLIN